MKRIDKVFFVIANIILLILPFTSIKTNSQNTNIISYPLNSRSKTTIETPVYNVIIPIIKQIIDSSLAVDPYKYLVLSPPQDKRYSNSLELEYKTLTKVLIDKINGVYIDSITKKPVIITGLCRDQIKHYGFVDSGIATNLIYDNPMDTSIVLRRMGVTNYVQFNSDSTFSARLGYNGQEMYKYPKISDKFSFLNPKISKDSILKSKEYESTYFLKNSIRRHRRERKRGKMRDIYVNETGDSIFATMNYIFKEVDYDIVDSFPVYKFDNSFYGRFCRRLCDSITANDINYQMVITSFNENDGKNSICIARDTKWQKDLSNINGIILSDKKYPLILYNLSPKMLNNYGLVKTNRKIIVNLLSDWIAMPYDTLNGYAAFLNKFEEGLLEITLTFHGLGLFEEEARPFQWIIEDYINEYNIEFQNNERARGL